MIQDVRNHERDTRPRGSTGSRSARNEPVLPWSLGMHRAASLAVLLFAAMCLGCAMKPRIQPGVGESRTFAPADRFAPASTGLLGTENPDFDEPALESLHELLETSIGWRGLTMAPSDSADWLVSCAFRKRLVFKGDISREPVVEPWRPQQTRVLGTGTQMSRPGLDQNVQAPEPWVETIVELRLRSRRTGTIGWSAQRIWGRNRTDLPEDELKATLQLLLQQMRFEGDPAPADAPAKAESDAR